MVFLVKLFYTLEILIPTPIQTKELGPQKIGYVPFLLVYSLQHQLALVSTLIPITHQLVFTGGYLLRSYSKKRNSNYFPSTRIHSLLYYLILEDSVLKLCSGYYKAFAPPPSLLNEGIAVDKSFTLF